jgi:hypothetical protein
MSGCRSEERQPLEQEKTMLRPTPSGNPTDGQPKYEAPKLFEIGGVYALTLKNCKEKKGRGNGLEFAGMSLSVSSC